jgi:hypothetical protein
MERLVGHFHLHQHVAREELALGVDLAATAHLDDLLGRNDHVCRTGLQASSAPFWLDVLGDLALEVRVSLNDVPALGHAASPLLKVQFADQRIDSISCTSQEMSWSAARKKKLAMTTITSTMTVEISVSLRVGQVTLPTS